jgi:hypothetical protein
MEHCSIDFVHHLSRCSVTEVTVIILTQGAYCLWLGIVVKVVGLSVTEKNDDRTAHIRPLAYMDGHATCRTQLE